jgi:lytic murein transglycosylase
MRLHRIMGAVALALAVALTPLPIAAQRAPEARDASFSAFLSALWPDARERGISRATFDLAFNGIEPDQRVIAATRRQPEYGKPFGDYVNGVVSRTRIDNGKRKAAEWTETLDAIEKKFGVERHILIAIWGIESSYGALRPRWDVIRSLATLAHMKFRAPYFRNELLTALRILQDGHIARERLLGSWAGAMGQPQFMPSSFEKFAADISGDGRRDIWNNVPDVLGSIANYLRAHGWRHDMTWGLEVSVPEKFDYRRSRASFVEWASLGVTRRDAAAMPQSGDGILFFPAGAAGPAFLVTANFNAIKTYNNSDTYALAVAHLADRIGGGAPVRAAWPADDRQLSRDARIALQQKLAQLGFRVSNFEAHIDFELRDAIRAMQVKFGMVPDGHPTAAFLRRLGIEAR